MSAAPSSGGRQGSAGTDRRPVVASVFGTRPEAIKMAPIVHALANDPELDSRVLVTAQHRALLDTVLAHFRIVPDADLDLMEANQTLDGFVARALTGVAAQLRRWRPDFLLVHGDTVTTVAASLAAFFEHIPCGHVEAGLRSGQRWDPFPEEMDRLLADAVAELHFAPTPAARDQLVAEGADAARIFVTGNSAIDALLHTAAQLEDGSKAGGPPAQLARRPDLAEVDWSHRLILVETHRRENWGGAIADIARAVVDVVRTHPDTEAIYSVHPNPIVASAIAEVAADAPRVHLCAPFDYPDWVRLLVRSHLIVSDSGGLQEEAPAIGKPLIVARRTTERPEAVQAGTARVAGVAYDAIRGALTTLLENDQAYAAMAHAANPFGDGHAAERTVAAIKHHLGLGPRPAPFAP